MSGFRSGGQGESWLIRRSELLCGVLLTVLILGLQGYRFTQAGGHWRDEATTLESANLASISDVWSAQVYNRPPILAYAVVRWWARIGPDGSGDANSQLLGAVTGAGIVVALWAAGWMAGSQAPILALALFGLNGGVLQWGGSLRGYGLGALLILVAAGLIWKVTESATPGRVTAAVVVSVLSVQCVFQNAALLFAVCVAGCLVCARKRNWRSVGVVLGIGAVAAFTLIPYLGIISEYLDHNLVARRSHSFTEVIHSIAWAMNGGTDISLFIWMVCGVTAMVGVTVPFSYARAGPEGESVRDRALYCAGVMVLGTVSFLLFCKRAGLLIHPWHVLPLMGLVALSTDILTRQAIATVRGRMGRVVFCILLAVLLFPGARRAAATRSTNIDVIAATVAEQAQPGDYVVVNPWYIGISFQRYYKGKARWTTAPPIADLKLTRFDLLREQMVRENPLQPVFEEIEGALKAGSRVWLVGKLVRTPGGYSTDPLPSAPHGPGGWINESYMVSWRQRLGDFLGGHAVGIEQVELAVRQPVSPYENLSLLVFEGWRPPMSELPMREPDRTRWAMTMGRSAGSNSRLQFAGRVGTF